MFFLVVMSGERFDSFAKWLPDWVALVRTLAERQNAFLREALEVLAGAGDSSPGPLLCFEILIDKKEGQWRPASHRAPLLGVHKKIPISLLSVLNFPRFQVPPQSFSHHFHSAGLRDGPLRWWFSEGQLLLAEVPVQHAEPSQLIALHPAEVAALLDFADRSVTAAWDVPQETPPGVLALISPFSGTSSAG